jgi:hypothetical protein
MPELPAGSRNRWFRLRLPGDCRDAPLWAERYFPSQAEAFDSYERRRAEHPTGRVHSPVLAPEGDGAWAVCVDPA